jgi:hypothetical protein
MQVEQQTLHNIVRVTTITNNIGDSKKHGENLAEYKRLKKDGMTLPITYHELVYDIREHIANVNKPIESDTFEWKQFMDNTTLTVETETNDNSQNDTPTKSKKPKTMFQTPSGITNEGIQKLLTNTPLKIVTNDTLNTKYTDFSASTSEAKTLQNAYTKILNRTKMDGARESLRRCLIDPLVFQCDIFSEKYVAAHLEFCEEKSPPMDYAFRSKVTGQLFAIIEAKRQDTLSHFSVAQAILYMLRIRHTDPNMTESTRLLGAVSDGQFYLFLELENNTVTIDMFVLDVESTFNAKLIVNRFYNCIPRDSFSDMNAEMQKRSEWEKAIPIKQEQDEKVKEEEAKIIDGTPPKRRGRPPKRVAEPAPANVVL